MDNQLQSLSKIFTEKLFRIPDYQRGYAWTEKHLKDFWNDIVQLEEDKNHYLGVLTLELVPKEIYENWSDDNWIIKSKSYTPFYVVDGQQRLTTSIVLIQSIIESVTDRSDRLNYTKLDDIKKRFIFDSKDDGISRSYIFGYEKDNPSYEFLKIKTFCEKQGSNYTIEETIYTFNLEFAKNYFIEKLKLLTFSEIENIYRKVTQNLLFNLYSISSDIDVFIAFETMNNRGKPLSHLELLKNRLIYLSTKFNAVDYEKEKLRKSVNECWAAIYHYLGKNKLNPLDDDRFLFNHFILYFGDEIFDKKSDKESFYRVRKHRFDFKDYLLESIFTAKNISDKDKRQLSINYIYDYVRSLRSSVETWYNLFNPYDKNDYSTEEKLWLDKLTKLNLDEYAPLVMVFFQKEKDSKKRVKFLKIIERLKFISTVFRFRFSPSYEEIEFIELTSLLHKDKVNGDKIIKELEEKTDHLINGENFMKLIKDRFKESGYYSWNGIRYFLFEYESLLQEKSKSKKEKIIWEKYVEEIEDFISVEHIYPQKPKKNSDWFSKFSNYNSNEKSILKNSLGNLLPLSRQKNSSLGNKSFAEKIGNDKSDTGYRFGSYSENEITKCNDWTAKNILERGIKMLNFMETRWGFDFGNIENKIDLLSLTFVVNKEIIDIKKL